jgi:hypothetical protein
MSQEPQIDPRHTSTKQVLRIVGPVLAGLGLLFTIIGFGSFFSSFGSFEPPRYFWCVFVGLPLLFVGAAVSMVAFSGSFARYYFGETTPVLKDTFNYLAEGTQGGVRTTAQAVGEGLSQGLASGAPKATCPKCQQANDADGKFCKHCGAEMAS